MYKEFRDTTLNGAVSQLCNIFVLIIIDQEMAGNHRAQPQTVHILRTSVLTKSADIKRGKTNQYRVLKFIYFRVIPSNSQLSKQSQEQAIKNSELYSKPTDPTSTDHESTIIIIYINKWQTDNLTMTLSSIHFHKILKYRTLINLIFQLPKCRTHHIMEEEVCKLFYLAKNILPTPAYLE